MNISTIRLPLEPNSWRADFPILSRPVRDGQPLVYLDNAATTQRPRQVIQAIVDTYENHYANVHRGIHWLSDQSTDLFEDARQKISKFINANSEQEVIFTTGTTMAINLVARSWGDANIRTGDEILLTEMEHHANLVPWHQLQERTDCRLRHIPITDDGQLNLATLDTLLTDRTRLVSITHVSNVLGTINPVAEIVARAHAAGAIVLVDAAQSAPHSPLDVQQLDADFVAFSGHKMMGPSGVGVLYGKQSLLEAMPPFLGGGNMIRRVKLDRFEPADLPAKFEAGTPPIVPAIGLGAAIDYLLQVGLQKIHDYEQVLTQYAHETLGRIPEFHSLGPAPERKAGIVSFTMDGIHPHDVAQLLDRHGIAVRAGHHCAMPLHKKLGITASSRASFYFYNTPAEIDQLAAALEDALRVFRRR
ncbi:MAG: cysteine desulfurase [Pirellulaceae bacterium]|nr:cysteine desulfurase [Planctomycetales bacterium]